jgi:hypothetical protein
VDDRRVRAKESIFRSCHLFTMVAALILATVLFIRGSFVLAALAGAFALAEVCLLYSTVHGRFAKK